MLRMIYYCPKYPKEINEVNNCIVLVPVKTLHKEPKYNFLSIEMKLGTFLESIRMVGNLPSILKCLKHIAR